MLSLTCLARINLAKDVSPCLGGHSAGWHAVSSVCPLQSDGCRAQCVISRVRFVQHSAGIITLCVRVCSEPVWLCPAAARGGYGQTGTLQWGSGNKLWAVAAILSGKGKLGTALPVLLGLLNCGMLVVDSVTFSVPCLPVFLYLLHLPLCQNAAIAKKKKNNWTKNFCFSTVSPFDNL